MTSRRRIGILAVLGAVICLAITPFMASVWAYHPGVAWSEMPLVERTFGPMLQSAGLLYHGRFGDPYEIYGKVFFLVYLLMLPVVWAIKPGGIREGAAATISMRSWRLLAALVVVAMLGDFASYWGKSVPGVIGGELWGYGFGVEMMALMLMLVTTVVFSISGRKSGDLSHGSSNVLILAIVAIVPMAMLVVGYVPNTLVLPLSLAWAWIGIRSTARSKPQYIGRVESLEG